MPTWTPPGGSTVLLKDAEEVLDPNVSPNPILRLTVDVTETGSSTLDADQVSLATSYLGGAVTISIASASNPGQDNIV